ncbi:bifunctional diguanylate cyclase/phosphodiesterase [Legionella maioricensis]|uniref:EAL domain-containing protein n=1 Tax=Legionella maioricensis TaxID=2896528 RepID=A0A9X2I9W1_9GAMM|nr:GGDEF domain-containing phosphodiesterase [Legionella maioricensis]MCL9683240.1 EAL domain-containing protein [Legionella maioricensis]MCL9686062.1 EAL domain-containing protein [Legionella maioricensis]
MTKLILSSHTCRSITVTLSFCIILIGSIGLTGWIFNVPLLKSISPHWISMKCNAAICILLSGVAIWLLRDNQTSRQSRYLARISTTVILTISLLTLIEYLFQVDLGIDQLLFIDTPFDALYFPGRMAFNTALNFVFISIALYLLDTKKIRPWIYQIFVVLIFFLSMFSFLLYVANVQIHYVLISYLYLAIHTVIAMLLIVAGLFFARPTIGIGAILLGNSLSGRFARHVLPAIYISSIIILALIGRGAKHDLYGASFNGVLASIFFLIVTSIIIFIVTLILGNFESKSNKLKYALEKREQLFSEFTENINAVLWRLSFRLNKITYVSPAYEHIWGRASQLFNQDLHTWLNAISPEDRPTVIAALNQIKNGIPRIKIEYKIIRADGAIVHISDQLFQLKNNDGRLEGVLGIATDITAQHNALLQEELLKNLNKNLSETNDIKVFARNTLKSIGLAINYDMGELWLFDEKSNDLNCIATWSKEESPSHHLIHPPIHVSEENHSYFQVPCFLQNTIQYSTHASHLTNIYGQQNGQDLIFKEVIGIPLLLPDKNIGVMNFYNKQISNLDIEIYKILMKLTVNLSQYIQNNILINQLEYISNYDVLTGLHNRNAFIKRLQQMIDSNYKSIVVIKLHINNLQLINNTLGYEIGNKLLQYLAKAYSSISLSTIDMIAVVQPNIIGFLSHQLRTSKMITDFANALLAITKKPVVQNSIDIFLTTNIGISRYPQNGTTTFMLMSNAELALGQAIKEGSNLFRFTDSETHRLSSHQIKIENAMYNALRNKEFEVYYQPKISLKTGKIISVEALIRWHDPQNGLQCPQHFLPVCEQSDLILEISDLVLRTAIKDMLLTDKPLRTSINLSVRQFNKSYDLREKLNLLLAEFHFNPKYLELEVTETLLMSNKKRAAEILKQLQELGISISLDDFGAGYSSFEYLKTFKPDIVKIDKSFIDGLPSDVNSIKIMEAMIQLSHSLNMRVIAEGVENAMQVNFLLEAGCDEIQGFYFSKPITLPEIQALINSDITFNLPIKLDTNKNRISK